MVKLYMLGLTLLSLVGCTPVKLPGNLYQLSAFSDKSYHTKARANTILVTPPDAVAGYQSSQMRYIKIPFLLASFSKNAWVSPPSDMIYPLLIKSLQKTHHFVAVSSGSYTDTADYRLDTQLLTLQQNFLTKPSRLEFTAKVVLTRVDNSQVIGSQLISIVVPCLEDSPYGGVVAANKAVWQFTDKVAKFVVSRTAKYKKE